METKLQLAQFLERSARLQEAEKILSDVDVARPESPPVLGDFELLAGEPLLAGHNYAGHLQDGFWQAAGGKQERGKHRTQLISRLIEAEFRLFSAAIPRRCRC